MELRPYKAPKSDKEKLRLGLCIASLLAANHVCAAVPICEPEPGRNSELVGGDVARGDTFQALTPGGWVLRLSPIQNGWLIMVSQPGREDEDISRLTPPWHGPNHRVLEGWQFRNKLNTGPNDGSVNEPQETRHFIFSPEVGRTLHYDGSSTTSETIESVQSFGRGWLYVSSFALTPPAEGERASFESITFTACLTWPE